MSAEPQSDYAALSDLDLAARVAARDRQAVRIITTRNNQRLFRAAWSVLRNRAEVEDAVQSAYLKGFASIGGFTGASSLSTWLTRIVINEALGKRRAEKRRRARLDPDSVVHLDEYRSAMMRGSTGSGTPEQTLARQEIRRMIEGAVSHLPDIYRLVFVLRDVEGLSVEETSHVLGVVPATVKTRLSRARRMLREALAPTLETSLKGSFPFAGADCEAMTRRVLEAFDSSA